MLMLMLMQTDPFCMMLMQNPKNCLMTPPVTCWALSSGLVNCTATASRALTASPVRNSHTLNEHEEHDEHNEHGLMKEGICENYSESVLESDCKLSPADGWEVTDRMICSKHTLG